MRKLLAAATCSLSKRLTLYRSCSTQEIEEASRNAARLGLDLESLSRINWNTLNGDVLSRIFLVCEANTAILRGCKEVLLHSEQRARACQEIDGGRSHELFTKCIFVGQTDRSPRPFPISDKLCIFVSDEADEHETWTLVRELHVKMVQKDTDMEITVIAGREEIATIAYNTGNMVLSRCLGRVGLALELLSAMKCGTESQQSPPNPMGFIETVQTWKRFTLLTWLVGVAVISGLVDDGGKLTVASGASHWMPAKLLDRLFERWPVNNGFIDVREMGMDSHVRALRSTEVKSFCPACWINPTKSTQKETVNPAIVRPTRLVGTADENGGYTAISYVCSEFDKSITKSKMHKCAAAVGGPAALWIDRECINQADDDEKNSEILLMSSYYAGAHTTLICSAREVVDVPIIQPSRHLVAIPERLRAYKGLERWKRDSWHERVWTYQEGALSKNPKVWVADQDLGLSACWLGFMSWAANHPRPVRCNIGLPPYYQESRDSDLPWGEIDNDETWEYRNFFARSWTTCKRHNWAPNVDNIRTSLARLIEITQLRKCTEPRDRILGILGLALSSDAFRTDRVRSLQDAYQEAIRSGSLGAEILLYGWKAPGPRSWIPKSADSSRWLALDHFVKGIPRDIEQPMVGQNGRLILRVYEVETLDGNYSPYQPGDLTQSACRLQFLSGQGALVLLMGCVSKSAKKYVFVGAEDKLNPQLDDGILICASEFEVGKHVLEGACRISKTKGYKGLRPKKFNLGDVTHLSLSAD